MEADSKERLGSEVSEDEIPLEDRNAFKAHSEYLARRHYQQRTAWRQIVTWVNSKITLYNVTFGLYILDWWEVLLVNTVGALILCFLLYHLCLLIITTITTVASLLS
ncbi:hypothetical protein CLOM_g4476 [Closterium sp. NIES-68]|nr:hypothetical protein CLOM_g4476 [Closterium sp. NIES-68]GJP81994.1 hypothetical protein CLOP_g12118 [Closterium sp. NIES-67]